MAPSPLLSVSPPPASASTPATSCPHLGRRPPDAMGVYPGRCSTGAVGTGVEIDRLNELLRMCIGLTVGLVSDSAAQQSSGPVDDEPTRVATGLLLEVRQQLGKGEVNSCFAPTGPQPGLGQPKIEIARPYPVPLVGDVAPYSRWDADQDAGTEHHPAEYPADGAHTTVGRRTGPPRYGSYGRVRSRRVLEFELDAPARP